MGPTRATDNKRQVAQYVVLFYVSLFYVKCLLIPELYPNKLNSCMQNCSKVI